MKSLLLLSLCLFASLPVFSDTKVLDETVSVNPYALPGDSERTQLHLPGFRFHEANDFAGSTDKLVTEAASFSVMFNYAKHFSTSLSYKGRYLTPVLKTKNKEDPLPTPLGIHAEWAETMLNQSWTIFGDDQKWAVKLDGGIGYNDFGKHSFNDIYKSVHEAINDPDESDKFGEPVDANFISSTAGASVVLPIGNQINLIGSYQIMNSKVFREDAQEATLIWSKSMDLAFSLKYSLVKQIRSEFFDIKNSREQFFAGLRIFQWWTPSIQFVSAYIKGDKHGQWYFSPVSLTYPF